MDGESDAGTDQDARLPATGAAQSAVFEGLLDKTHFSISKWKLQSHACRAAPREPLHFLILFDPLSFVSAVPSSWPLLPMLCEDLICQRDGPDPPTKGMLKI